MDTIQINLFAAMTGCGVIIAAWALYRVRVINRELQKQLNDIRSELLSTTTGSIGVGKRLIELEKKLQGSLTHQEDYQQGYTPYSKATELLGGGADLNDVIKNCGISRAEAELMQLMHRQMKRCGPTH